MKFLLKIHAVVLSLLALGSWSLHGTDAQSTHVDGEALLTLQWEEEASLVQLKPRYEMDRRFLSQVYKADYGFELLGLNWEQVLPDGTDASIEIRFQHAKGEWSAWEELHTDEDQPTYEDEGNWTYVITAESFAFQYRVFLWTEDASVTPKLANINFDYVDGGEASPLSTLQKLVFKDNSSMISRKSWGADENLRVSKKGVSLSSSEWESELSDEDVKDDPDMRIVETVKVDAKGNKLIWPLEYPKKVKKIIIHHTATTENLEDPDAAIRAIYYYHAVTRGWGDIGYNYIVAPDGTVYEGRAGGDGVVAGHAAGYNTGSVGIALLGNYQDSPIPGKMLQSLADLVYEKSTLHGIDPDVNGVFRGESIPNVLGHRDVDATACPGDFTYDYLSDLKNMVGNALDNRRSSNNGTDYAYEEMSAKELLLLDPGGEQGITVKIKNTGTVTWNSDTYLVVNANSKSDEKVKIPKDSKKRTAQMKETSVKPGGTATFTFKASATMNGGIAYFDMSPIFNGSKKTQHTMDLGFYVEQAMLSFSVASNDAPSTLKPGQSVTVNVKLKNTGNLTWSQTGDNAVKLKKSGTSSLVSNSTLAAMKEKTVKPGETASFSFSIKASSTGGSYTLYFRPEMENSNAVISGSGQIKVSVTGSTEDAQISAASTDLKFTAGENKKLWVSVKNTSTSTWKNSGDTKFSLSFSNDKELTVSNPIYAFRNLVSGASTKVFFSVKAPSEPGTYTLSIRPRLGSTNLTKAAYSLILTVEGVDFEASSYEDPIRVKLTPDNEVGTPILSSVSNFALYDDDEQIQLFTANSRVRVTPENGKFKVTSGSNKWTLAGPVRFVPDEGDIMKILTMDQRASWDASINDNQFRGTIEVRSVNGETILINELPLEEYLIGLAEETNTTPTEKLKAMAVVARSYAYYYLTQAEKFPGMPYDGEDDPNTFQKYLGYGYELRHPNVAAAAQDTEGVVVSYKGTVIKTPYFSSSDGGKTKSAKDVWGWTNTPYLVSVDDSYCSGKSFAGHGVGLSGCGAKTMAELGFSFEEIIKHYYTGVELTEL